MLHDYILVKADDVENETKAGIVLAPSAVDEPATGTVVSAGPGAFAPNGERMEHGIEAGDKIIFGKSALREPLTHEGEKFYVMKADAIFGVDK